MVMQKPLDINEPTIVDLPSEIIAYMLMTTNESSVSVLGDVPRITKSEITKSEIDILRWRDDHGEMHHVKIYGRPPISTDKPILIRKTDPKILWTLEPGEFLESGFGPQSPYQISMSAKDIRRWELAYQGIGKDKLFQEDSMQRNWLQAGSHFRDALTEHPLTIYLKVNNDIINFLTKSLKSDENGKLAFLALVLLPAAYGGIHLAAWGFEFPSPVESLIWKISCVIIMSYFFINSTIGILVMFFPFLTLILCAAARIFLVLESFLSLRHVPIGVYAAVPWVQNIPHI